MKSKLLPGLALIFFAGRSLAQSPVTVYIDCLQTQQTFFAVGDTVEVKGADVGRDSIDHAMFILKDKVGSYKATIYYKLPAKVVKQCYQGNKSRFGKMNVPVFNAEGNITANKEELYWKPVKLAACK